MKKIFLTVTATFLTTVMLCARPTGFNIGGGITYLGWTSNTSSMPKDYIGPYVEVGYDLKVAKNSYIYFGGRFSNGFNVSFQYPAVSKSVINTQTTIIGDLFIPIRFQQNFQIAKNTDIYLEAGPAAGFLLYNFCRATVADGNTTIIEDRNLTYSGEPRANFYLGGNLGFNIKRHVKIYFGGDYGFVPFKFDTGDDNELRLNRWQLNLGACYVF